VVQKRKIFLIAAAAVVLLGLIVGIVLGVRTGSDITKSYQLTVTYSDITEDNFSDKLHDLKSVLRGVENEDGRNYRLRVSGSTLQSKSATLPLTSLVVTLDVGNPFADKAGIEADIKTAVTTGLDKEDFRVEVAAAGAQIRGELVAYAAAAVALGTLVYLLYVAFRYGYKSGIAALLLWLHNALVVTALVVIARLEIGLGWLAALAALALFDAIGVVTFSSRLNEGKKDKALASLTRAERINRVSRDLLVRSVIMCAAVALPLVAALCTGLYAVVQACAPVLLAVAVSTYAKIFVFPGLRELMPVAQKESRHKTTKA
jgi:preprotein translocase subunit SecF